MKKTLVMVACLGAALSAYGQGALNFNNKQSLDGINAPVFDVDGATKLDGANGFVAQIAFSVDVGGALTPVGDPVAFSEANKAGYIAGGAVVFPVGGTVQVAVQAWNSNDGGSYADAMAAGGPVGQSAIIAVDLTEPPTAPANLVGLESFQLQGGEVIPEPSTFALGLIGLGALMLRRRK